MVISDEDLNSEDSIRLVHRVPSFIGGLQMWFVARDFRADTVFIIVDPGFGGVFEDVLIFVVEGFSELILPENILINSRVVLEELIVIRFYHVRADCLYRPYFLGVAGLLEGDKNVISNALGRMIKVEVSV